MEECVADLAVEFLGVAFNNILYFASLYPETVFERRKKYNVTVYKSVHPEINQYLDLCLKSIAECIKSTHLRRVEFVITDDTNKAFVTFVFEFELRNAYQDCDTYFIQSEQNLRAFCLKVSTMVDIFKRLPEDSTFSIKLHTNESTAVSLSNNPEVEDFPLLEAERENIEVNGIIPIRRFDVREYNIDTYLQINNLNVN